MPLRTKSARERMLCIVTPGWPGGALDVGDARLTALHALCDALGVVHFAAVALLPPRPDEPACTLPSLMLELVVDEGLRPDDLLQRLALHPSGALWQLYGAWWPAAQPGSVGARNEALLTLLRRGLSVADGAFVGPRDLSVAQVRAHRRLTEAVRAQAAQVDAATRSRRESFALALARWAFVQPAFEAIAGPAPRSWWRLASGFAKLRMLATRGLLAAVALWLLRGLARCVHNGLPPADQPGLWPGLKALVRWMAQAVDAVASWLLQFGGRVLLFLLAFAVVYLLLFVLLPGLWRGWRSGLEGVNRWLDSPGDSLAASTCRLFGLLLLPWLAVVMLRLLVGKERWRVVLAHPTIELALVVDFVALVALGLLLAIGLARPGLSQGLAAFRAWFTRTSHAPVPGSQQVHPTVEASDTRLVGGTALLISLTEMRTPNAWSAAWTRFFLRVVTWAGHVFFTEGRLGDLRGIQFGHWHIIDGGRRYLFCSNYDGNFGGYLDDFIKGAAGGTTLFWRWTHLLPRAAAQPGHPAIDAARRFPPTRLLAYRGVKCEQAFKTYARDSMLPPLFRYDACGLTGQQKIDDRRLRDALFGTRTDANDDVLMRALER
jgi:hypothetical protein